MWKLKYYILQNGEEMAIADIYLLNYKLQIVILAERVIAEALQKYLYLHWHIVFLPIARYICLIIVYKL